MDELSFTLTPVTREHLTEEIHEIIINKYFYVPSYLKLRRWRTKYFG